MAIHVKEFEIDKFRGIDRLRIEGLNHVNLLLGDNNTGKTSVLECMRSICEPASFWNWHYVSRMSDRSGRSLFEGMYNLFPADENSLKISYAFVDNNERRVSVVVKGDIEKVQIQAREMERLNGFIPTGNQKDKIWDRLVDSNCLRLEFYIDGVLKNEFNLYDFLRRIGNEKVSDEFYKTVLVRPMDHINEVSNLNAVLEDAEYIKKFIDVLKIYDNSIEGIQSIDRSMGAEYKIVSSIHKKAIPLSSYGDGMKKAVELVSAVVSASGGLLLIDEFETSIHVSAMAETFQWVLDAAKEMNVQLVMTTHSCEALNTVLNCKKQFEDDINVYTLYKKEDKNYVRKLNCREALDLQNKMGLELR